MKRDRARILSLTLIAAGCCVTAVAQEKPTTAEPDGKIFRPAELEPTAERRAQLKLPPGFEISVFAEKLGKPRMLAVAPDGRVYVTRRGPKGDVLLLRDTDGDGKAEPPITVATIPHVHGIALRENTLFLAAVRELYRATVKPDGTLEKPEAIIRDLPDAGQHPNRTLAFSPKGELFLSVGSTCNAAPEPNPENATMLVVKPDGSSRAIFASGLRNTIGFAWHPASGELFGMDHGIDWLGDDGNREELNHLQRGKKYGWPFVYEDGKANPGDNPKEHTGLTWEEYAKTCENPVLTYTAHAAPMALHFYTGKNFPEEYRGDAFVTFHGSWNRGQPSGYNITRVKFAKDGKKPAAGASATAEFTDFLTGFYLPAEKGQFGRPCALAELPDGSLLLSDDGAGTLYRIRYTGK